VHGAARSLTEFRRHPRALAVCETNRRTGERQRERERRGIFISRERKEEDDVRRVIPVTVALWRTRTRTRDRFSRVRRLGARQLPGRPRDLLASDFHLHL